MKGAVPVYDNTLENNDGKMTQFYKYHDHHYDDHDGDNDDDPYHFHLP